MVDILQLGTLTLIGTQVPRKVDYYIILKARVVGIDLIRTA